MEVCSAEPSSEPKDSLTSNDFLHISCNWRITNNKQFKEAITTVMSSDETEKANFDEVVTLDTCISLEPVQPNSEPCMLEIKLLNHQRISRIAVASEAYVLEFFKQFGEYETTVFAEFIDEFKCTSVYFAETRIFPSSTEASIKFTKTKNKTSAIWIYGIRLYLREPLHEPDDIHADIFNPEIIKNFLAKLSFSKESHATSNSVARQKGILNTTKLDQSPEEDIENNKSNNISKCETIGRNTDETPSSNSEDTATNLQNITMYIDNKFHDLETRLFKRIDEMEQRTNQKLDIILKMLET